MLRRQPRLPRLWLMTDERMPDVLAAVALLPRGSGVVFRHHATAGRARRALFGQVRAIARRRALVLVLAARPAVARAWGADGAHHRSVLKSRGLRTVAVHDGRELVLARRIGADLIFVSPLFATRSHPGGARLGIARTGLLTNTMRERSIALGGMNRDRAKQTRALGLYGWAAIDALS